MSRRKKEEGEGLNKKKKSIYQNILTPTYSKYPNIKILSCTLWCLSGVEILIHTGSGVSEIN